MKQFITTIFIFMMGISLGKAQSMQEQMQRMQEMMQDAFKDFDIQPFDLDELPMMDTSMIQNFSFGFDDGNGMKFYNFNDLDNENNIDLDSLKQLIPNNFNFGFDDDMMANLQKMMEQMQERMNGNMGNIPDENENVDKDKQDKVKDEEDVPKTVKKRKERTVHSL